MKYTDIMTISVSLATIKHAYGDDVLWGKQCRAVRKTTLAAQMHDLQTAALCDQGHGKLFSESVWILKGITCVLKSNFLPCSLKDLT